MKLIFEKSVAGRRTHMLPECDTPSYALPNELVRKSATGLPEVSEADISRHYSALNRRVHGVNSGFYPLGSCTMKYNPRLNEETASLSGFSEIHPLQPPHTAKGCLMALDRISGLLCEITGMDAFCMQPSAGAHGEFLGLLLIKAYHQKRGDAGRVKIIVPDSAHGTNPASAAMAGFEVISLPSRQDGRVDLDKLREVCAGDTAGLMLTNPNTLGVFETDILEITRIVHAAGGLCYYDGANLNAVMGVARPGDMGFDVVHLNLHKTFSTPHGGGGPGSGPVGCKAALREFLPEYTEQGEDGKVSMVSPRNSVGRLGAFHGNFAVIIRALTYIISLGGEGLKEASHNAVLNANYLLHLLKEQYTPFIDEPCMHEFVLTLKELKSEYGVSALDVAKTLLDRQMHPPTMYFPLIVHEALMLEPTETEGKAGLDEAAEIYLEVLEIAKTDPERMHSSPVTTPVRRLDEVAAARNPRLRYRADAD